MNAEHRKFCALFIGAVLHHQVNMKTITTTRRQHRQIMIKVSLPGRHQRREKELRFVQLKIRPRILILNAFLLTAGLFLHQLKALIVIRRHPHPYEQV